MSGNLLVINVDIREIRVALIEDGIIAELHIERLSSRSTLGNICVGTVSRVLPGMQAAFIDIGQERAAFLHVEDLIRPDDFEAYMSGRDKRERDGDDDAEAGEDGAEAPTEAGPAAAAPEEGAEAGAEDEPPRRRRRRRRRGKGDTPEARTEAAVEPAREEAEDADEAEETRDDEDAEGIADEPSIDDDEVLVSEPQEADAGDERAEDDDDDDDDDVDVVFDGADDDDVEDTQRDAPPAFEDEGERDDDDDDERDDDERDERDERDDDRNDDERDDDERDAAREQDDDDRDDDDRDVQGERDEDDRDDGDRAVAVAAGSDPGAPSSSARSSRPPAGPSSRPTASSEPPSSRRPGSSSAPPPARDDERDEEPARAGDDDADGEPARAADDDADGEPRRRRRRRRRRRAGAEGEGAPQTAPQAAPRAAPRGAPQQKRAPAQDDDQRGGRRRRRRARVGRAGQGGAETGDRARRPGEGSGSRQEARRGARRGGNRAPDKSRISKSTPIREVVREGQHVVVQVTKEPIGTKGARVSSHISLAGRYVVYLPTVEHVGISKRIGGGKERGRLRAAIDSVKPPVGGLVVRTVAEGLTKKHLKNDVGYLVRLWDEVCEKKREMQRAPALLYEELDLVLKTARDLFTEDVARVVIDNREQYGRLKRFVEMFLPERADDVELYEGQEPLFDAYGIEDEIGRALSRKVPLASGGHLIIDQAEALTAIDVNTGRYVGKGSRDLEDTILQTNLEAVREIAYQLRFRNIGGLIILDLIDMERRKNREKVRQELDALLAKDKAKTTLNRISELGLMEMTRKRTRESLGRLLHEKCFYCDGTGQLMSRETVAYEILRQIRREQGDLKGWSIKVNAHPAIVDLLKTEEREAVQEAERMFKRRIELVPRKEYHLEQFDLQGG